MKPVLIDDTFGNPVLIDRNWVFHTSVLLLLHLETPRLSRLEQLRPRSRGAAL